METRMNVFQSCSDTTDVVPLSASQSLFLKPVARLNISVQLPSLKQPGKSISNWEVMEKLRYYAAPEEFTSLKVSKSTLEVVRFEGEIENRSKLKSVLARLDGRSIKLSGFPDSLKVRAAEAKPGLSKHSWDSYFRDAKNMNEMKPGERPDTVHITNLPCRWFATKSDDSKPSEYILRKVFEMFGEIRCVDIPTLDPFRSQMKPHISGIKMFSNNQNMIFEAYIQFKEYICFVKTMDTLRNMKLLHIDSDGKAFSANIKVDFDKTKHLSDSNIRRRRFEREKLMSKEREREEKERQAREEVERKHAEERKRLEAEKAAKLERQQQREERRKAKQLARLKHSEADEMNKKIATEERLLLMAQRRLESFRLLGELFNRLKTAKQKEREKSRGDTSNRKQRDRDKNTLPELSDRMDMKEKELREKLVKKFKHSEQSNQRDERRDNSELTEHQNEETYDQDYNDYDNNFDESRNFQQFGHFRGGWRGRLNRRRRGNMPFRGNPSYRGNQYPAMPFHQFHNRKPFFNQKDPQWSHFPTRNRGRGGFIPPPFIDPYLLEAAVNDPYYKYFQKLARRRSSRSRSRSYSRSRSRSYSRSRSRSYSRSSSSRSRHRSSRSRSRSRRHRRSRSRSKSRSRRKSKDRKRTRSHSESRSSKDKSKDKEKEQESVPDEKQDQVESSGAKWSEKAPSVHTWSRSPSRPRSLSWEKRKDEPSSSSKKSESSSKKKKKKHKKDKKKKKLDTD